MRSIDTNGTGKIDYTNWLAATLDRNRLFTPQVFKVIFAFFDKNKSGFIEEEDLQLTFAQKKDFFRNVAMDIIKEADTDNDGKISEAEFVKMMTAIKDNQPLYSSSMSSSSLSNSSSSHVEEE